MGNSCVKPKIAPVSTEGAKRKGGSVASGSAASRNKRGNASEAGAEYRNEVLLKLKQNAGSNSVTGVHAALGVEYIRMENKLLQKNVDRVLSMVGKDGRTVTTTISLKLALREEDCLKTPAECMIIDAAFSMENGRLSKAEERRQHWRPHRFALDTPMQEMTYMSGRTPSLAFLSWKDVYSLCSRFKVFVTISSGPNAKAEQEEMDEVIPWWRQNFIEEFGALAADVIVENTDEANFLGGTEEDRKLTKERIQPSAFLRMLSLHRMKSAGVAALPYKEFHMTCSLNQLLRGFLCFLRQERHMHCALHIIGSMTDSWNMKRHYIDELSECPVKRPHAARAEICHILGCPELISGFAKIKVEQPTEEQLEEESGNSMMDGDVTASTVVLAPWLKQSVQESVRRLMMR